MALAKTLQHNNTGVNLAYWRITRVEIDGLANSTVVIVSGYVSQEARNSGKRPIGSYKFLWTGANNPITPQILMAGQAYQACYNKIKSETASMGIPNPTFFTDAESV